MKKILLIIFIILIVFLGYVIVMNGMDFLGVASIDGIQNQNDELNKKLQEVSTLTSTDYPKAITDLNDSAKQLLIEKQNYADLVQTSTTSEVISSTYVEKHNLEHLWVKIGNHATKHGITLKMDIVSSSGGAEGRYNLNFTANGEYVSISEFIAALEDDSTLEFRIEDFKLVPTTSSSSSENNLQATFVVKDIAINIEKNTMESSTNTSTGTTTDTQTNTQENAQQ